MKTPRTPATVACRSCVDALDQGMRVRRAQHVRMELAGDGQIVDEAAASGKEALVLAAAERVLRNMNNHAAHRPPLEPREDFSRLRVELKPRFNFLADLLYSLERVEATP